MRSKPIKMYPIIKEMLVHEWYRNGDHPEDRTVNRLNDGRVVKRVSIEDLESQIKICPLCKQTCRQARYLTECRRRRVVCLPW